MKQEETQLYTQLLPRTTELAFPIVAEWPDSKIFQYLSENRMTIPGKVSHGSHYFTVTSHSLGKVQLPAKYRIPLLWTVKYQWHSLFLVLTATNRQQEWEEYRLRILHVARVSVGLLEDAKGTIRGAKSDRTWRCPMFDRVLVRYWDHYLINDPQAIKAYLEENGEVPFKDDILRNNWRLWATTGHSGFFLSETEIENGLTDAQMMQGFTEQDGVWTWISTPNCIYLTTQPVVKSIERKSIKKKVPKVISASAPVRKPLVQTSKQDSIVKTESSVSLSGPPKVAAKMSKTTEPEKVPSASALTVRLKKPAQKSSNLPKPPSTSKSHYKPSGTAPVTTPFPNNHYQPHSFMTSIASAAPPTPLLASLQLQLTSVSYLIEDLKVEQSKTKDEQAKLRQECLQSQLEIRNLKRSLGQCQESEFGGIMKKRRIEEVKDDGNNVIGLHPLRHLLEVGRN